LTRSSSPARAQDQHRRAGLGAADSLEHLQAVHVGQHQVQNHQVVIGGVGELERARAVGRGVHGVAGALQAPAQEVGDALFVLDHQESLTPVAWLETPLEVITTGRAAAVPVTVCP
jgi:hypothetical protein